MKIKPYPDYKPSKLLWLNRVPFHWDEKRAKYYFREIDERSKTGDEEMLSVSHITGVTPRSQKNVTMFKAETNVGDKLCRSGDLVINTMWAWMAAMGISGQTGIVSPSYGVYRLHNQDTYDRYYLDCLLRSEQFRSEYICRSTGIRSSRLRLYPDQFLSIPIVCPPHREQEAMSKYLEALDSKVRTFIRNKRRLVELLREQKQAIINKAVTRGITPDVKLKPSGIEWLGDIPEQWEVRRLKTVAKIIMGQSPNSNDCNIEGIGKPFLQGSSEFKETHPHPVQFCPVASKTAPVGSILLSVRAPVGLLNIADQEYGIGRGLCAIVPVKEMLIMEIAIHAITVCNGQLLAASTGSTYDAVTTGKVGNLRLPIPTTEEQIKIVDYLNEKCSKINAAIFRAEQEVELIKEYKTRLISDVVTGKVDVRDIVKAVSTERKVPLPFKRAVLAAEIVDRLHNDPTFGRVKFQKVLFLCEYHLGMKLEGKYQRKAAGPFDNRMLRSVEKQMKTGQWYTAKKDGIRTIYVPLKKRNAHRKYFDNYWADYRASLDSLIELLRPLDTEQSEIVATLFAAWNDLIILKKPFSDDDILKEVLLKWSKTKERFTKEQLRRALQWMRDKKLVPKGLGKPTVITMTDAEGRAI